VSRILAVARREFRQLSRDRVTFFVAFGIPLVLITLYGFVLTTNIKNLGLTVEDLDQTPMSRSYIEAFAGTRKFVFVPVTGPVETMLQQNTIRAALRIPPHFERDIKSGAVPQVQLLIDGTESNSAMLIRGVHKMVAQTFRPGAVAVAAGPAVHLHVRHWYNPGLKDELFFGSGALGLVLILLPSLLGALSASREIELGTITQAYACRLSAAQWILGKAIPYVALGCAQFVLCFSFGFLVFGYTMPDHPAPFLAGAAVYILTAVLYGMLAGHSTRIQSAAIQAINFGAFILSLMLSGFFMPIENIPAGLRWLSNLVPARHFIEITRDLVLRGGDWNTSARPLLCLAGLAVLFFLGNLRRMRRMQFEE
jgi:ABC-2 type transport system permease protein